MTRRRGSPRFRSLLLLAAVGGCSIAFVGHAAHTCAVLADGTAWCWGYNDRGQLGDGTRWDRLIPAQVSGLPAARAITAGLGFTCAATEDGRAFCWGRNDLGQLGAAPSDDRPVPAEVAGLSGVTAVTADRYDACAIHGGGSVSCWGSSWGAVTLVEGLPPGVVKVQLDGGSWCALIQDGSIWCSWGGAPEEAHAAGALDFALLYGELCALEGDGTIPCAGTLPSPAVSVAARAGGACAVLEDGAVSCWRSAQAPLDRLPASAAEVAVGEGYACALLSGGEVACWGDNWGGQLGDGTNVKRSWAVTAALPRPATTITASSALDVLPTGCSGAERPEGE